MFNNDPLQTAFVEFLFTDENCLRVSSAIHVAPGHHGSGTVPAGVLTGPVNCLVQFPTANKVSGGNLTVGFYAVANGQATAAIPVTNFRLNLPVCK